MSIEDIQGHHKRFITLSDQFKAVWTFHQMLQAIYKHFISKPLPYHIDFKVLYGNIKALPQLFQGLPSSALEVRFEQRNKEIRNTFQVLQEADRDISPSLVRKFFEQRIEQENLDKILHQIIKFYLYNQTIDQHIRDKLDFLITHLSSQYSEVESKFILRDTNHLKEVFEKLMSVGHFPDTDPQLKDEYFTLLKELKQEVMSCQSLEDFVLSGILKAIRGLKGRMGTAFLHPDILLKVAELNVTTKNRYTEIYEKEEKSLLEDTSRIRQMTDSGVITSPKLVARVSEIEKMQAVLFGENQQRELKIEHLAEYKKSVKRILEELDSDFTFNVSEDMTAPPPPLETPNRFMEEDSTIAIFMKLGKDGRAATGFRLEEFEFQSLKAYELLHSLELLQEKDQLILKCGMLRYHNDLIVSDLLDLRKQNEPIPDSLMKRAGQAIELGQNLEKQLQWDLDESLFKGNLSEVQLLTRAKYRLSRSLSGMWLLYDSLQTKNNHAPAEAPED